MKKGEKAPISVGARGKKETSAPLSFMFQSSQTLDCMPNWSKIEKWSVGGAWWFCAERRKKGVVEKFQFNSLSNHKDENSRIACGIELKEKWILVD